jgi:hypothetical protein
MKNRVSGLALWLKGSEYRSQWHVSSCVLWLWLWSLPLAAAALVLCHLPSLPSTPPSNTGSNFSQSCHLFHMSSRSKCQAGLQGADTSPASNPQGTRDFSMKDEEGTSLLYFEYSYMKFNLSIAHKSLQQIVSKYPMCEKINFKL